MIVEDASGSENESNTLERTLLTRRPSRSNNVIIHLYIYILAHENTQKFNNQSCSHRPGTNPIIEESLTSHKRLEILESKLLLQTVRQ